MGLSVKSIAKYHSRSMLCSKNVQLGSSRKILFDYLKIKLNERMSKFYAVAERLGNQDVNFGNKMFTFVI